MQTRQLGNSDLHITPIGFGAWAIGGGGWAFAWGTQDDAESVATIREAIDLGINWIDTAAVYGLGHSEEVVAKALEGVTKRPYVFTKCGRVWDENGQIGKRLKAASIRAECEASLRRLKVDVIDLYQIHWPEPDEDIEEGWQTMLNLKDEGKIRWVGVSNFSAEQMARIAKFGPITSLQPPYSLIRREVESVDSAVLPEEQHRRDRVFADGLGLLTGTMTRERIAAMPRRRLAEGEEHELPEPLLTRNLKLVELLKTIGAAARQVRRARSRSRGCCGTRPSPRRSSALASRAS